MLYQPNERYFTNENHVIEALIGQIGKTSVGSKQPGRIQDPAKDLN